MQLISILSNSNNETANRPAGMSAEPQLRKGGKTQGRQDKEDNCGFKDRDVRKGCTEIPHGRLNLYWPTQK